MGIKEFMCLCTAYGSVKIMSLCTEYLSVKWYFLLMWEVLDLSIIIKFVQETLSGRTHSAQAITSQSMGENALKKQAASYDKLSVAMDKSLQPGGQQDS